MLDETAEAGASDVGKTTLLQWLVSRRAQVSKVIVIDPHAYPDKWQQNCVVVGTERNYPEIDRALEALVRLMTKRYEEIGQGAVVEQGHARITILIDEWRAIVYNVKGASEAIKALLTESRKAAFSVFVATHSDRAKPLGLDGEYDLKDGFAVVRLSLVNGQRQATLDTGSRETPTPLPGPFRAIGQAVIDAEAVIDLGPQPTLEEGEVLRLHKEGKSISAIATEVFGSKGGHQNQRVRTILQKFNKTFIRNPELIYKIVNKVGLIMKKHSTSQTPRRAIIYARVSSTKQLEGVSIESQIRKAKAYADIHDIEIVAEYADDFTGYRISRPQFDLVMDGLRLSTANVLITLDNDRISRDSTDSALFSERNCRP